MRRVVLVVLAACGRVGFQPTTDAALPDLVDTLAPDAAPCMGPYGTAVRLDGASTTGQDWGGHLSDDGLELLFGSDGPGSIGSTDLFVATRPDRSAAFGAAVPIAALATTGTDDNPFLGADGLTLWFDRDGDLYTSVRADRQAAWQPAQPVPDLNSAESDVAIALSRDELAAYFSSTRPPSGGDLDLWLATRSSTSLPFSTPIRLATISAGGFECCPQLTAAEDELMFSTSMAGATTIGVVGLDATTRMPVGTPAILSLVDGPGTEIDVFATRDGTLLGFSVRPTPADSFDLYLMERSCP